MKGSLHFRNTQWLYAKPVILTLGFVAALALFATPAQAACTSPTGDEGKMLYNQDYHTYQFCNGTDWLAMGGVYTVPWQTSGTALYYNGGNVGIGTASPVAPLEVDGNVHIANVGEFGYFDSIPTLTTEAAVNGSDKDFRIKTTAGNVAGLVVKATTGNVGIGTTGPGYKLEVQGTAYATGAAGALSDRRHKKNIRAYAGGLNVVEKLQPVTFEWRKPTDDGMKGTQIGFIAQDVEKALPDAVLTMNNKERTKGLKYDEIIPVLTNAIKELKADNDNLRAEFEAYKKAHP